jgi:hypothetical protein
MHQDLYAHPLIKPLLDQGPTVPGEDIERLAEGIGQGKILARKCNILLSRESSFNTTSHPYLVIWLAFALARAQDKDAISKFTHLFELVDPLEHDMLWELAQFALWQYGDRAARLVLNDFERILKIDHTGYYLGVLEVTGLSKDQLLRRRVANHVINALASLKTTPAALMGLVDIALILQDDRLPSILNDWKIRLPMEERRNITEVEQILLSGDPSIRNDEFTLPWYELAEYSAEHFAVHIKAKSKDLCLDEPIEELTHDFEDLALSFRTSPRFQEIPKQWRKHPEKVVRLITEIFQILYNNFNFLPEEAEPEEIASLMVDVLPRKMKTKSTAFKPIPSVLAAVFKYLTDGYSKEEGEKYAKLIRSSEEEMMRRARNPKYWDVDKIKALSKEGKGQRADFL